MGAGLGDISDLSLMPALAYLLNASCTRDSFPQEETLFERFSVLQSPVKSANVRNNMHFCFCSVTVILPPIGHVAHGLVVTALSSVVSSAGSDISTPASPTTGKLCTVIIVSSSWLKYEGLELRPWGVSM